MEHDGSNGWPADRIDRIVIVRLWSEGPDRHDLRARVVEVDPASTVERTSSHVGLATILGGVEAALERFAREVAGGATEA